MSRVIVAISFLFLSIYCPYVASDPDVNNTTSEIENLKNICEAADPVSLILQSDECIVDPVMKEVITGCRFVSYGSSDVSIATATFCSATDTLRREMDELFEVCLMEKGLTSEMMQLEWAANCAFCQNIALVNKTEECFENSPLRSQWVDCRFEIYQTQDAMTAAEAYCSADKETRVKKDRLFDECLAGKNITRESFEASVANC